MSDNHFESENVDTAENDFQMNETWRPLMESCKGADNMKIEILGTGCPKCQALEATAKAAADKLGIQYELAHVKDIAELMHRGVMITPALVIDGDVKVSGKVPSESEITTMLTLALAKRD